MPPGAVDAFASEQGHEVPASAGFVHRNRPNGAGGGSIRGFSVDLAVGAEGKVVVVVFRCRFTQDDGVGADCRRDAVGGRKVVETFHAGFH